jgi:hypothetical protein
MASEEVERARLRQQEDFTEVTGKPFEHFFCPLLLRDEPVELCMGHVIPQSLPDCVRSRVLQRKDIDNFYGRTAEADFGTLVEARGKGLKGIMQDPDLQRRIRPQLLMDGDRQKYYPFLGGKSPHHTRLSLQTEEGGKPVELVVAMKPEQFAVAQVKPCGFGFEYDCRLPTLVTMIKAAYLTLFRIHGYQFALSAGAFEIGRLLLGGFFLEHGANEGKALQKALKKCFLPYKHMVRPIDGFVGDHPPRGTVEDYRSGICFGGSGKPFAQVVYIRVGAQSFGVLMPGYENADSVVAYHDFLKNDNEVLRVSSAWFNEQELQWEVSPEPMVTHWPKHDVTFEFDPDPE